MEATIQSTNKAIIVDVNVSINIAALKANIQHGLQAIKQRVLSAVAKLSIVRSTSGRSQGENCQLSIWRVYRHQLRLARAVARAIDRHDVISNLWIGGWTAVLLLYIVMFA